jgi:hypothetical protein
VYALVFALLATLLGGCMHKLAPPESDALAKEMQPVAEKAVIYLFRNEPASAPWPIHVTLDQKDMGTTGANTYFRWEVEPGRHILVSRTENKPALILDAQAGRIYYVWQEIRMGFFRPQSELREVDRETAQIALRDCYLL